MNETLENYALFQFIKENVNDEKLSLKDAKDYYQSLKQNHAS
jgi:hypothetical protein